jgi:hypothetical protein
MTNCLTAGKTLRQKLWLLEEKRITFGLSKPVRLFPWHRHHTPSPFPLQNEAFKGMLAS